MVFSIPVENLNTLKEIGYTKVVTKMSTSAENAYFGKMVTHINIIQCQTYTECVECPQYCACNHIDE